MRCLIFAILILLPVAVYAEGKDNTLLLYKNEEAVNYSMPISRQLNKINSSLNEEISNTKFYSATQGFEVEHKIVNGKLNFIVPTESELQGDLKPGVSFKYVSTPMDKVSECFKYLGWSEDPVNPVWQDERITSTWRSNGICTYHPFILEGETKTGRKFKLSYVFAFATSPQPSSYSTNPNSFAAITLDTMENYAVVTENNPLPIKIEGDWDNASNISLQTINRGKTINLASKLTFDNETHTYKLTYEELALKIPAKLNFYSNIKYKSNKNNPKRLQDTAGYNIYIFPGVCTARGTIKTDTDATIYAMITCNTKFDTGKTVTISQRTVADKEGAFEFTKLPNSSCTVQTWDLTNAVQKPKFEYLCDK